jgi:hypothetical protein
MRGLASLTVALALISGAAHAQAFHTPRTPWGDPDLQGVWTNTSLTMLERTPMFKGLIATDAEAKAFETMFTKMVGSTISTAPIDPKLPAPEPVKKVENSEWIEMNLHLARIDGKMRSSWIVEPDDGKIPFTEAGKKARDAADVDSYDNPEGRPLSERCLISVGSSDGPPMMNTGYNANYQILQTPDHVAIEIEMVHEVRIVRLGDRSHLPDAILPWQGDSVGWWEGDTLVVETTNFNPKSFVDGFTGGFALSPHAKLTERFTRTGAHGLLYSFTVEDPAYFSRAWRAEMPWRSAPGPIYEYACHEGNYSLPLALSGARVKERAAGSTTSP